MLGANVIATSGRAVEAAGDVDVLLLDKTGTITLGNRQASAFLPAPGVDEKVHVNIASGFHGASTCRDDVSAEHTAHPGDTDRRQQPTDGGWNQTHQKGN